MSSLVHVYLGWRLLRLLRPLLAIAAIFAVVLSLHLGAAGQSRAGRSAASALRGGMTAGDRNITGAFERAFKPGSGSR